MAYHLFSIQMTFQLYLHVPFDAHDMGHPVPVLIGQRLHFKLIDIVHVCILKLKKYLQLHTQNKTVAFIIIIIVLNLLRQVTSALHTQINSCGKAI